MTSVTSGVGAYLGSILGPWRGPHFGRPNRASGAGDPLRVTDLAAGEFGARQDVRLLAPKLCSPILGLKTGSENWGAQIGPLLSGAGLGLGPKMAPAGPLLGAPSQAVGAHST